MAPRVLPAFFRRLGLGVALSALATLPVRSDRAWRRLSNDAFKPGETIVYEIRYGPLSAGTASLHVRTTDSMSGRDVYHIVSTAKTNKALDKIFKVRDNNDSWMDTESLCSLQFMQNVREGGYRKWSLTTFDQPKSEFHYLKKGKGRDDAVDGEIPPHVQDVLSSLYFIRTLDLTPGEEHTLHANSGGKNWPLKVIVHGEETVTVSAGAFACYRLEPRVTGEGLFLGKGTMQVWMTKDKRKIPVLLRSEVAVGAFEAQMTEYSIFGKSLQDLSIEP